ncbi:Protein angel -like protein 2, partial [Toxocara canis]
RFSDSTGVHECDPLKWTHNLKMASVYSHLTRNSAPEVSTFQSEDAHNPDFIFYSVKQRDVQKLNNKANQDAILLTEGPLHLVRRLTLPDETVLRSTLGPWPNSTTPSDHIPLIADFVLE